MSLGSDLGRVFGTVIGGVATFFTGGLAAPAIPALEELGGAIGSNIHGSAPTTHPGFHAARAAAAPASPLRPTYQPGTVSASFPTAAYTTPCLSCYNSQPCTGCTK